jgi:hypothetical protein
MKPRHFRLFIKTATPREDQSAHSAALTSDQMDAVHGGKINEYNLNRARNWLDLAAFGTTSLAERIEYLNYAYANLVNGQE